MQAIVRSGGGAFRINERERAITIIDGAGLTHHPKVIALLKASSLGNADIVVHKVDNKRRHVERQEILSRAISVIADPTRYPECNTSSFSNDTLIRFARLSKEVYRKPDSCLSKQDLASFWRMRYRKWRACVNMACLLLQRHDLIIESSGIHNIKKEMIAQRRALRAQIRTEAELNRNAALLELSLIAEQITLGVSPRL